MRDGKPALTYGTFMAICQTLLEFNHRHHPGSHARHRKAQKPRHAAWRESQTGLGDFAVSLPIGWRDEGALLWKVFEDRRRLAEVIAQQIGRVAGDPLR
jgi:hypothetical protein